MEVLLCFKVDDEFVRCMSWILCLLYSRICDDGVSTYTLFVTSFGYFHVDNLFSVVENQWYKLGSNYPGDLFAVPLNHYYTVEKTRRVGPAVGGHIPLLGCP